MKKCALAILILAVVAASAAEPPDSWRPFRTDEIARQFPKHPRRQVVMRAAESKDYAKVGTITQIGIETTACYGNCPVYTFIVNTDGTFRYHGMEFCKRRGDWQGTVDAGRLNVVLSFIREMGYFALADEYASKVSDLPGTYSMVKTRTRKKVIFDYDGAPARLRALEMLIADLQIDAKWKRSR